MHRGDLLVGAEAGVERSDRDAGAVDQIGIGQLVPAEAEPHGGAHFGRGHEEFVVADHAGGGMEKPVLSGQHQVRNRFIVAGAQVVGLVEFDDEGRTLRSGAAEGRRQRGVTADAVGLVEHQICETAGERHLVARMDILGIAAVGGGDEAGVGIVFGEVLLGGPEVRDQGRLFPPVLPRRQLHDEDRHIRVGEVGAPGMGESTELFGVAHPFGVVVLALIPEHAAHRKGGQRMNHRVEQHVGQPLLVLAQIGVLFAFQVGDLLCNLIGDPLGHGDGGEGFRRGHRFDPAAAPRDIDQADRDVQLALEVPADQIADSGEARKRLRRTEVPLGFHVGLRCPAPHVRHLEEPDVGIRKRLDQLAAAGDALQPVLHIGLPRAEPDVADQHVAAGQGVVALDGQRRSVGGGRERCELHLPPAVLAGGGGNGLPGELHRNRFSGASGSPDRHRAVTLQNHVVGEDRRQFHRRQRQHRSGCQKGEPIVFHP